MNFIVCWNCELFVPVCHLEWSAIICPDCRAEIHYFFEANNDNKEL